MAAKVYPPLREDVRLSRRDSSDGPRIVVKDPVTQRFFQLREAEYAVLQRLDGARSLDDVAKDVGIALDAEVSIEAIEPFVQEVQRLGLLGASAPPPPRRKFAEGHLLYVRFKAFDPDRLLDRLIRPLGPLFTPRGVVLQALAIAVAIGLSLIHHDAILADIARQWRLENLLFAWVTILVVTAGHEFAHGLTCKRFGGEVHEMGFLLLYLQPAFYCNISDAWLMPQRSRRLWVTFAGAWFELCVWAAATLIWRVAEPGTWIARAALVVLATTGIKLLFNLNPLIKLDGYYLLSDLIDVPNLRQRSIDAVAHGVKRLFGVAVPESRPAPRERRLLFAFGVLALGFTWWLLAGIASHLTGYLTDRYRSGGAILSAGFISMVFWPQLKGFLPRRTATPDAAAPTGPAESAPLRAPRFTPRVRFASFVAAVTLVFAVLPFESRVAGEVRVRPYHNADVRAEVEGLIDQVYVAEGDRVDAGDTIARISGRDLRGELDVVHARIAEQDARLRLLRAGPRAEEVELARVAVARADELLRFAVSERERVRLLRTRGAASEAELDVADERTTVRSRELDEARAKLGLLRAGARAEELRALEEERAGLVVQRENLTARTRGLVIVAPHAGVITTPRLHERLGAHVMPGDLIAEVHAFREMRADLELPEREIGDVVAGQRAQFRFRAHPSRTFDGRVVSIAPAVSDAPDAATPGYDRTVRVELAVADTSGLLASGLSGLARISIGQRRGIDIVTRRVRRYLRLEFWSWW